MLDFISLMQQTNVVNNIKTSLIRIHLVWFGWIFCYEKKKIIQIDLSEKFLFYDLIFVKINIQDHLLLSLWVFRKIFHALFL